MHVNFSVSSLINRIVCNCVYAYILNKKTPHIYIYSLFSQPSHHTEPTHRPSRLRSIHVALNFELCQSPAVSCTAASAGLSKALCLLCHPEQLYTRPRV